MPDVPHLPRALPGAPAAENENELAPELSEPAGAGNEHYDSVGAPAANLIEVTILANRRLLDAAIPLVGLFQDIPRSIWSVFLWGWGVFFALLWLFFAVNAASTFFVTIVVLFGVMAFGLPLALAKQCHNPDHQCFGLIQTHTGPISTRSAAVQIALIPVAVDIGLLGFILFAK